MLLAFSLYAALSFTPIGAKNIDVNACPTVKSVKTMHFRDEWGYDDAYDRFRSDPACENVLIASLLSVELMTDPRQTPVEPRLVVGDTAALILIRIYGLKFSELLPETVNEKFPTQGVTAYFDYVQEKSNRAKFASRMKAVITGRTRLVP